MTQIQWQTIESMIGAMTPDDKHRLASMLATPAAAPTDAAIKARERELELLREIAAEEARIARIRNGQVTADDMPVAPGSMIGCMADESDLLDQVMESVYRARETHPLRVTE
jgi:hypothetical protein